MGPVLRVLRQERRDRRGIGPDEVAQDLDPDPAQAGPILGPAVDEDRRLGSVGQVADAGERQRVVGRLRLLVERAHDRGCGPGLVKKDEADGHEARPTVGRDRGERRRPGLGHEGRYAAAERDAVHRPIMHRRAVAPYTPPVDHDPDLPPTRHVTTTRIVAVRGSSLEFRGDRVVGEEPLEIRAAGPGQDPVAVAITMRTPGHEAELALGFLRTEGLIDGPEVLRTTTGDPAAMNQPDDQVTVHLARAFDASRVAERHFVATASCGICGKATLDEVAVRSDPIPDGPVVARRVILALPDLLRAAQRAFDETGGLHAAGLFTPAGELIALREDVGRHNALDKVVGSQLLAGSLPLHDRILMVSGRVSFEIVQKAAVAGVPIVCAVSAPSDLAIEAADRLGVTLVGFLREDGFNVYAHDERIDLRDLLGFD